VKANYPLTHEKMMHILEELRRTAYSTVCPHGRPVMLRITRAEEYFFGYARTGFQGRIRMGFDQTGRVTAADLYIVQENGATAGFPDGPVAPVLQRIWNLCNSP
jgi:xanthine dehydrogenase molybdopterin-binding subunit B